MTPEPQDNPGSLSSANQAQRQDQPPAQPPAQPQEEVIDLTDASQGLDSLEGAVTVEKWRIKESGAKIVAQSLVAIFGLSILLILAITFGVFVGSESPEQARAYAEVLTPVLKELASFMSSVFGPLLAFILGYYFSDKQKS